MSDGFAGRGLEQSNPPDIRSDKEQRFGTNMDSTKRFNLIKYAEDGDKLSPKNNGGDFEYMEFSGYSILGTIGNNVILCEYNIGLAGKGEKADGNYVVIKSDGMIYKMKKMDLPWKQIMKQMIKECKDQVNCETVTSETVEDEIFEHLLNDYSSFPFYTMGVRPYVGAEMFYPYAADFGANLKNTLISTINTKKCGLYGYIWNDVRLINKRDGSLSIENIQNEIIERLDINCSICTDERTVAHGINDSVLIQVPHCGIIYIKDNREIDVNVYGRSPAGVYGRSPPGVYGDDINIRVATHFEMLAEASRCVGDEYDVRKYSEIASIIREEPAKITDINTFNKVAGDTNTQFGKIIGEFLETGTSQFLEIRKLTIEIMKILNEIDILQVAENVETIETETDSGNFEYAVFDQHAIVGVKNNDVMLIDSLGEEWDSLDDNYIIIKGDGTICTFCRQDVNLREILLHLYQTDNNRYKILGDHLDDDRLFEEVDSMPLSVLFGIKSCEDGDCILNSKVIGTIDDTREIDSPEEYHWNDVHLIIDDCDTTPTLNIKKDDDLLESIQGVSFDGDGGGRAYALTGDSILIATYGDVFLVTYIKDVR